MRRSLLAIKATTLGPPAFRAVGNINNIANSGSTADVPTVVNGDCMLGMASWQNATFQTATIATPTGWTARSNNQGASAGGIAVASRVASSEPSTYAGWTVGSAGPPGYAVIATFSKAAYNSSGSSTGATGSSACVLPSVAATAGQRLVRFITLESAAAGGVTPAAGYTEHIDGLSGAVGSYIASRLITVSGATGTESFACATSANWRSTYVLLDPA